MQGDWPNVIANVAGLSDAGATMIDESGRAPQVQRRARGSAGVRSIPEHGVGEDEAIAAAIRYGVRAGAAWAALRVQPHRVLWAYLARANSREATKALRVVRKIDGR